MSSTPPMSYGRDHEEKDLHFPYNCQAPDNDIEFLPLPSLEFTILLDDCHERDITADFISQSRRTPPLQDAVKASAADHDQLSNVVYGAADGSSMKKLDHNAKERVRRLRLTESYLALRSLLPDHPHKSKKKWSAPHIIDRALEYIPELEVSVQRLTFKKNDMITVIGKNKQPIHDIKDTTIATENQTLTVSVNEVKRGEVIVQICMEIHQEEDDVFSNLIDKVEGQGLQLQGASSLFACEDRCCYHLHLKMDESKLAPDYIASLKGKDCSRSKHFGRDPEGLLLGVTKRKR
ncbi:hypothetical protein Ancab_002801 [Ancistrocladus abbreviatus]